MLFRSNFICNRHKSIGADGILFIKKQPNEINLRVLNSDASEAKNCGNGIRCVAQWFFDKNKLKKQVKILLKKTVYLAQKQENKILVDMQTCTVEQYRQNFLTTKILSVYKANVKNAHLVWIFKTKPESNKYIEILKSSMPDFNLYNHNFVWFEQDNIYAEVFEKGVGFTQSCGSGAIASACAVAIFKENIAQTIHINQPGGLLIVVLKNKKNKTFFIDQIGIAKKSFHGFLVID